MVQMKIVILGTSSAKPTEERSLSSLAILREGELLLFDAGEGAQKNLIKAKLGLNRKMKIFITHLHGDHCVGLLGLLQTMSMANRDKPLHIYGPRGLSGFIKNSMKYLRFHLTYSVTIHQIRNGVIVEEEGYIVKTCRGDHSINNQAYLLEERPRPGIFNPEKATKLGIPEGNLWSDLQHGKCVKIKNEIITPNQLMGEQRSGRSIGISGDTRPSIRLSEFFSGVDVLIFDSTYDDDHLVDAVKNFHSTSRESAELAKRSGAAKLILTHFSSRYHNTSSLVEHARELHPNVVAAFDLMTLEIPYSD